jgi:extracellular factor (EF) 3-hydroxypalmitic acid methyl ester biosynthesis protein
MNLADIIIDAYLIKETSKIPIAASYGSKETVLIRFPKDHHFEDGSHFSDLQIQINGADYHLGPCSVTMTSGAKDHDARLTFVSDVYDLQALFAEKKLLSLQDSFANLQLVLDYKIDIKASFRDYAVNLLYDLNVYRSFFDELDQECVKEPEDARTIIQKTIIDTEGRKFMQFLDKKLAELEHAVFNFSRQEHESHGYFFRRVLWDIIMCSPFMKRTNLKPQGYAGDYVMMKMLYLNQYEGTSTFSKLMHKHPVEHPAAKAVRNRRKLIMKSLKEMQAYRSQEHPRLKVLSVACGPAFELQDILLSPHDCDKYQFTFLDQDPAALDEARLVVNQLETGTNARITATYLNESVRTMLKSTYLVEKWGMFDFIYSMGLFDYLTPPVGVAVLGKLYELLNKGGELLIGNFHVSNPSRCYMEYWLDWVLYYRTEEDLLSLLPKKASGEGTVIFEDTGSQMFLRVKKQ